MKWKIRFHPHGLPSCSLSVTETDRWDSAEETVHNTLPEATVPWACMSTLMFNIANSMLCHRKF
jgi:hypothetical protein